MQALRQQQVSYEEIHKKLHEGVRIEVETPPIQDNKKSEKQPETALAVQAFETALSAYEKRLTKLETRLEETTDKLIEAEKRAAAAEAQNELLKQQEKEKPRRRWFWEKQ